MSDIKRLHYFNHQFLVESDFADEQQYHLAMRRRHNAALHDYGVADGLAVTRTGDREITVQPGLAIDRDGRELVLLDSRIVGLSDAAAFPAGATIHLTIAYDEAESDPSTATGVTGNTRIIERPQLVASTTAPAGDGSVIRLARFTLTGGGKLPGNLGDVFADGRQLAGAALAPASVATDRLADAAVDENKLSAGVRGKLVSNGDGHDHSGGDGAQIRHSSLSLDGGRNPHGTTAADVGALATTGGTIEGNLLLHRGNVGLGTTPQPESRLSLRSDDGPAGIASATLGTTSSDGTGNAMALWVSAEGSGTGLKEGIQCWASGSGEKRAALFAAESRTGSSDYTSSVEVRTNNEGSGATKGLQVSASGLGGGQKEGIVCTVEGSGNKYAGQFRAYSNSGTADGSEALRAVAHSEGTGGALGFRLDAYGSGPGLKQGILAKVEGEGTEVVGLDLSAINAGEGRAIGIRCATSGSGNQFAGHFEATSGARATDQTRALSAYVFSEGAGVAHALVASASGVGTGAKYGVWVHAYGAGEKHAGTFRADSSAGSTDNTLGLEVVAQSEGTGGVSGIRAYSAGSGGGFKEALSCSAMGSGPKRSAYFSAESQAGSADHTNGVYVFATSAGTGEVIGLDLQAQSAGGGGTFGIRCATRGAGSQVAADFRAVSEVSSTDETRALSAYVSGGGSGTHHAMVASCGGSGTGHKYGIYAHAYGSGEKHAGHFYAESPTDSTERTNGVHVGANSSGSGSVYGLTAVAVGSGTGAKYALHCEAGGNGAKWAGYFVGNVHVNGVLSKAGGTFLIDHPLDPENKTLRHSFVESPEDLCLYRGKVQLDATGKGSVKMPSYFAALTKEEDATVSLTAIGSKPFLTGYEWNRNFTAFIVYGEPGREVSYLVLADRDDPVVHQLRRPVEEKKGAGYFQKGELLNPEAYGKAPRAAPDGVGAARQTTAPMDMAPPSFLDLPAHPTPTTPPDFPLPPVPTAPFPAREEEHRQIEEAWARSREEQRQRMESFQHEEQQLRRQLEETLAAPRQQPDHNAQERGGPIETLDEAPETPSAPPESAPPESAPPRRKKTVADRKKK